MTNHGDSSDDVTQGLPRWRREPVAATTRHLRVSAHTRQFEQHGQEPAGAGVYRTPPGQYGPALPAHPVQPPVPMAPPAPAYSSFVAVSRPAASGTVIVIAWILALCSMLYLLPWAVAATRNKSGEIAIFLINFFLGWTVIGWFVALIMACCPEPQTPVVVINHVPPPQPYYR